MNAALPPKRTVLLRHRQCSRPVTVPACHAKTRTATPMRRRPGCCRDPPMDAPQGARHRETLRERSRADNRTLEHHGGHEGTRGEASSPLNMPTLLYQSKRTCPGCCGYRRTMPADTVCREENEGAFLAAAVIESVLSAIPGRLPQCRATVYLQLLCRLPGRRREMRCR